MDKVSYSANVQRKRKIENHETFQIGVFKSNILRQTDGPSKLNVGYSFVYEIFTKHFSCLPCMVAKKINFPPLR